MPAINQTPTSAVDVVGVYQGNSQVFEKAAIMSVQAIENKDLMQHPVESARLITDHIVIKPTELILSLVLSPATYREIYQEIKSLYTQSAFLSVITRADVHSNIIIEAIPREETPEKFNTISIELKLREVLFAVSRRIPFLSTNSLDSTNSNGGQTSGEEVDAEPSSVLYGLFF